MTTVADQAGRHDTPRDTRWLGAVGIHAGRVLRHRFQSPPAIGMAAGLPLVMLVLVLVAFDGMVEQFTGRSLDIALMAVMVAFSPLIMVAMFFNTAMMPRDMYAEALRPVVDASPVTAVTTVVTGIRADAVSAGDVGVFAAWFGGLIGLSVAVLALRARSRR